MNWNPLWCVYSWCLSIWWSLQFSPFLLSLMNHSFVFTTVFLFQFIAVFLQLCSLSSLIVVCQSFAFTTCYNTGFIILKFQRRVIWMRRCQFLVVTIKVWLFAKDITLYLFYFFSLTFDNSSHCCDSVVKVSISDCIVVI